MDDPFSLPGLLADGWLHLNWQPFRDGVEMAAIVGGAPAVAVLRYAPGSSVPLHRHPGLETILVLDGVQSDERGNYPAGTLIVNPVGSSHSVWSVPGCVVLIQWTKPVEFL